MTTSKTSGGVAWRIIDLRHQKGGQIRIVDSDHRDVANILARHPDALTNARLIAAAPLLLKELQELRANIEAEGWELDPSEAIALAHPTPPTGAQEGAKDNE